jgi:hypothetical protein
LQMADDMQHGREILGRHSDTIDVCYVACHRPAFTLRLHMDDLGIDPATFPHLSLVGELDDKDYALDSALNLVRKYHPRTKVVFLDGMNVLCPGKPYDEHDVSRFLINAARRCRDRQLTLIGCIAASKQRDNGGYADPLDRASGSHAWMGQTGTKILIERYNPKDMTNCYRMISIFQGYQRTQKLNAGFNAQGQLAMVSEIPLPGDGEAAMGTFLTTWLNQLEASYEFTLDDLTRATENQISRATLYRWLTAKIQAGAVKKLRRGMYGRRQAN